MESKNAKAVCAVATRTTPFVWTVSDAPPDAAIQYEQANAIVDTDPGSNRQASAFARSHFFKQSLGDDAVKDPAGAAFGILFP